MTIPVDQRFGKVADLYDKYRPGYPDAVVEWLASTAALAPGARVLDVGCGTGIAARLFARHGFAVTAVDPNPEMLDKARARGGGPEYAPGRAEATGQADASFDLAYAAQAFHWFDVDGALSELRRVLRPSGWASAFWNLRAPTPAMDEYEALLRRASREYVELERPNQTIARLRERVPMTTTVIDNAQRFDWEGLRGRVHSSSYIAHGVDDLAAFDRELREIYERHVRADGFEFAYRTHVFAWQSA